MRVLHQTIQESDLFIFNIGVVMLKKILPVLFLGLTISVSACEKNEQNNNDMGYNQPASLVAERKAPDFSLKTPDGKLIKLSNYKGKVVILDFWATWCPPCRKGIPDLIAIQKEFPKDVVVIGVSVDQADGPRATKDKVAPFIKEYGINYPVVFFDKKIVEDYGGIESIPTAFVIDQKGNIVDKHVGLVAKSEYVNKIKSLLGKK